MFWVTSGMRKVNLNGNSANVILTCKHDIWVNLEIMLKLIGHLLVANLDIQMWRYSGADVTSSLFRRGKNYSVKC